MFLPILAACLHPALVLFPTRARFVLPAGRLYTQIPFTSRPAWLSLLLAQIQTNKQTKYVWIDQRFRWFRGVRNSCAVYLKFWCILVLLNEIVKPNFKNRFHFCNCDAWIQYMWPNNTYGLLLQPRSISGPCFPMTMTFISFWLN